MKWRWRLCAPVQRESRQLWDYVKRHVSVSFLNRNCLPFNSFSPNISPALWFTILTTSTNREKHVEYFFITFTISTSFGVWPVHSAGLVSSQPNENARILFSFEATVWIPRVVRTRFSVNPKFRNGQIYFCETCWLFDRSKRQQSQVSRLANWWIFIVKAFENEQGRGSLQFLICKSSNSKNLITTNSWSPLMRFNTTFRW